MPGGKFLSDDLLTKIAAENNLCEVFPPPSGDLMMGNPKATS